MLKKSLFEYWESKELPERVQEQVDSFASATHKSNAEQIFRAGFYMGLNSKQILKELEIEAD